MLSVKQGGIKYHFWVFGLTRPWIEPQSPFSRNMSWCFQFGTFISAALYESMCIFISRPSLSTCNSFPLFIHSNFLLCSLYFHILLQKCCFLCIQLLIHLRAFSPDLLVEFSFVILEGFACIVLLFPSIFSVFFLSQIFFGLFIPVVSSVMCDVEFYSDHKILTSRHCPQ